MPLSFEGAHRLSVSLTARAVLPVVVLGALLATIGCGTTQTEIADGRPGFFGGNRISGDGSQRVGNNDGSPPSTSAESSSESSAQATAARNEVAVIENLNLGHREVAANHPQQAEKYYHRVLALQPNNAIANHRLAVLADKRREYATAEYYYLAAMRLDPNNPDLLSDFGYSCYLQGRLQESERSLLAATRVAPSHEKATHNLGILYAAMGDYDRSHEALKRALGESRAQIELAQLFPDHRPPSRPSAEIQPDSPDAQAGSEDEPIVASFEPFPPREDKSNAPVAQSALRTSTSRPVAQLPVGTSASKSGAPISNSPIPNGEINETFTEIDRGPATSTRPPSAELRAPSQAPVAETTFDCQELRAVNHANPLDAMPLWPTESASSVAVGETSMIADSPDNFRTFGDFHSPSLSCSPSAHTARATITPEENALHFDEQRDPPPQVATENAESNEVASHATAALGMDAPESLFPVDVSTEIPVGAADSLDNAFDAGALKTPRVAATEIMVPSNEFDDSPRTFVVPNLPRSDRVTRQKNVRQRLSQTLNNATVPRARFDTKPPNGGTTNSSVSQVSADRGFRAIPYDPPTVPLRIPPHASTAGSVQPADTVAPANVPSIPDQRGTTGNRGLLEDAAIEPDEGPIIRPGLLH